MIQILRSGHRIKVIPPCFGTLRDLLTYTKRIQVGGQAKPVYVQMQLYKAEADGLIAPVGMLSRIMAKLTADNLPFQYTVLQSPPMKPPDYSMVDPRIFDREGQSDVLAALITYDYGVIDAPAGYGKSFLIVQMCKMWPNARFIICSPYTDVILDFYATLKELFGPNQVGLVGAGGHGAESRIVCAISNSLSKCKLNQVDFFLFDEVHRAAAPATAKLIATINNSRMYGFSASVTGRSDGSDLETEGMFGPVIGRLDYQQAQAAGAVVPIVVVVYPCAHLQNQDFKLPVARDRNLIWRNQQRNALIRDMVRDARRAWGDDIQILISVSKVDHAIHLGALLPDFTLVYGGGGIDAADLARWEKAKLIQPGVHPLTAKTREEHKQNFRNGDLKCVIATEVWSTGVSFPKINVMIRADGSGASIGHTQWSGRLTRTSEGKSVGILLDLDDSFNKTYDQRVAKKLSHYRKKGWQVVKLKPGETVHTWLKSLTPMPPTSSVPAP